MNSGEDRIEYEARGIGEILRDVIPKMDKRQQGFLRGVPTGFVTLDHLLGGFRKKSLIVVGSAPDVGRTTFALNVLRHVCFEEKHPALLHSLELAAEQIVERLLCMHFGIDTDDFRHGEIAQEQRQGIEDGIEKLAGVPLQVDDASPLEIQELQLRALRTARKDEPDIVVVDDLSFIRPRSASSRQTDFEQASAGLKRLAQDLDVPVLVTTDLQESFLQEPRREPTMDDVPGIAGIERHADTILLLHRIEEPPAQEQQSQDDEERAESVPVEILVARNRIGPTGMVRMLFHKRFSRLMSY